MVRKDNAMNWDQVEATWRQFGDSARERWGKITHDDWEMMGGKKDQLVGWIQERYGVAKTEAEKQVDDWCRLRFPFTDNTRQSVNGR
jgi:uncharacterized protein YjbJ (UPF0337 family)